MSISNMLRKMLRHYVRQRRPASSVPQCFAEVFDEVPAPSNGWAGVSHQCTRPGVYMAGDMWGNNRPWCGQHMPKGMPR